MLKARYSKDVNGDIWDLIIGNIYNFEIKNGKYVVYDIFIAGHNSSIISITYADKEDFSKRFIDISEERKLKLKKINER